MIADALFAGHVLLADWLFVFAAVLFIAEAVAPVVADRTDRTDARRSIGRGILLAAGLALLAIAWLVLQAAVWAVDWNAVTIAGAFGVGALVGTVVVLRLARVMAQFFGELRDRHDPPAPRPPT